MQEVVEESSLNRCPPYRTSYTFRNWARTIKTNPQRYFEPINLSELIAIVNEARKNGKKIALRAEGHTWSPLSVCDDYLVSVKKLNQIRVHRQKLLVTVQVTQCKFRFSRVKPGVTIRELDTALTRAGLCLPTNVVLKSVRYGGVIATGCHGAGWDNPCLSDFVVQVKMVNCYGYLITINHEHPELLKAARVNLGTMGIMYEITLQVQPLYRLKMVDRHLKFNYLFDPLFLEKIFRSYHMTELFWMPFTNRLWLKTWTKTKDPITLTNFHKKRVRFTQRLTTHTGVIACKLATKCKIMTPALMHIVTRFLGHYAEFVGNAPDMIHYRDFIEDVRCYNTEFAIPLGKNYENVIAAWTAIVKVIDEYKKQKEYPINICIEMRVTKNSESYLAPCFGKEGERFAYIEVISYLNTPKQQEAARKISYELMKLQGRCHWAKMFQVVPEEHLIPHLRSVYGKRLNKFAKLRDHFDPERMFLNAYMEEILYDGKYK